MKCVDSTSIGRGGYGGHCEQHEVQLIHHLLMTVGSNDEKISSSTALVQTLIGGFKRHEMAVKERRARST